MKDIKFKLTSESIVKAWGIKLFRIEATCDIPERNVKKGDKGGYVESTHLSNGDARVSGNAWVSGDAWAYGNAQVSGDAQVYGDAQVSGASLDTKASFTAGLFVGRNDGDELKLTVLHKESCGYWDNTYVLGDYKIEPIDAPKVEKDTINIGGKSYEVTPELTEALKNLKEV